MNVQCLYQNDVKDGACVVQQRNSCRTAANKLNWKIQQERVSDTPEGTPLMMRPEVQAMLRDVEQKDFQVLLISSLSELACPAGELEGMLAILEKGGVRVFAARPGQWLIPGGRNWPAPPKPDWTCLWQPGRVNA